MNTDQIRIFADRFVFRGDDFVGRWNNQDGTFVPIAGMELYKDDCRNWLQMRVGRPVRIADQLAKPGPQIEPLPDHVLALRTPQQGADTPAVKAWVAANRPEEFKLRYRTHTDPNPDPEAYLNLNGAEVQISIPAVEPEPEQNLKELKAQAAVPVAKPAVKTAAKKVAAKKTAKQMPAKTATKPAVSLDDIANFLPDGPKAVRTTVPGPPPEVPGDGESM